MWHRNIRCGNLPNKLDRHMLFNWQWAFLWPNFLLFYICWIKKMKCEFQRVKLTKWRCEGRSSGWQGSGDADLPRGQHESLLSASSEKYTEKNIRIKNCDKKKQIYAKLGQTNEPLSDASLQKKTNEKENVPLFGQPQNGSGLKHPKTERNHNIFAFDGKIYIHNAFVELHHIFDPFLFITLPNEPKRSRKMKWLIVGQHSNSYIESDSLSSLMHNIYLNRHTAAYNHINRRTRRATGSKKH